MNKYLYTGGGVALALAMSGLPAMVVHAENDVKVGATTTVSTNQVRMDASTTMHIQGGEQENQAENQGEGEQQMHEMIKERVHLDLEDSTTSAMSLNQLKQMIQERKQELDDEEASTSPEFKDIVKNANEVRLAVRALLASKELLGGIGPEVSEIAKHMNDSVATTTNAEAKIESRGFFTKLLFGGDKAAADVISNEVAQDQQNIAKLTDLLNQANTTSQVKAVLAEQIAAMQAQITRLQDLAAAQAKLWGIFSWRF